ncbi:MAG: T9SS type A sorting domain-containing protein, partial [Ignavibacteriaceae bacterium]|nr:T9SS type A sorting domain-containing protein [Ignavibacteriaceae bacterium]
MSTSLLNLTAAQINLTLIRAFLAVLLFLFSLLAPVQYSQTSGVQPTPIPGSNSVTENIVSGTYTYSFFHNGIKRYEYRVFPGTTTSGKYLQVGNYANLNSMRLMSFKTSAPPYYFLLSNAFNWIAPQQIEPPITDREGVITKDTTSLYFSVGEITVDGEKINFVALPDTSVVNGSEALNTYLISEPFNLTENTFFTYAVQYGVTDSLSAAMTLTEGKSVNFRVELMDEQTNEVLGTFDDVTFSEGSIIPYESIAYQVNTKGIGNRICRLRLVIDDNLNPDYSLTNDYNGEAVLSKQGFVERTLTINKIVKTYELEQNYPNPFNPSTIIKYQIPKDGTVTLKIYDVLGSEVATLVNEQKVTGKYEVNFNASKFASGVYIYRLSVNDPSTSSGQSF